MKTFICFVALLLTLQASAQTDNLKLLREKTERELQQAVQSVNGVLGFVALDLVQGERFAMNESLLFPQASAIKIPILMEVFKQAHEGKFNLSDMMWVEKKKQVGGSGILFAMGDHSSQLSVRDLCVLMIVLSDNTATNMLIDRVGMDNVNTTLGSLGLTQTKVRRHMMDQAASVRGDENLSTPAEAARVMEILHKGEFIDRAVCDAILEILQKPKPEVGAIQSAVPENIAVECKSGDLAGVNTEWAIVRLPNLPYVVVVMENYGAGDEAVLAMRKISGILYSYFSRVSTATKYGTYVPR